ncbi:hypothetical protein [Anaeromicropila populeti]|uniref:CvpA family protein n=1 Tax=Anaeromicropila populeti TaxID=37658 RepID=A0A1I6KGG9_9FIRM|nr:hypothetical protein [Anaeromicropila populeti]SFR90345.1 hypothetical protein SAMN05661086_02402 [Anaeromicropila populeti]
MKKTVKIITAAVVLCLLGFIYYYITLPAINIHSKNFWFFMIGGLIFISIAIGLLRIKKLKEQEKQLLKYNPAAFIKQSKFITISATIIGAFLIVFIVGAILSSPIVNAKKYRQLITIENGDFQEDIQQISYSEIPLLDRASATLLGSRKMGSMVEYVSQFEVAGHYTQINYKNQPVRVTPLEYGSLFKWLSNRSQGIPAYIMIDMATQEVECVKLSEGIKYTDSEHFGRNIYRYLRFRYPTYIFDDLKFEIDDNGTPYWICPAKDFTIGLFGGEKIKNVVLVNAVTGEHTNYKINEVPTWVDQVYDASLLTSYYNFYGSLQHGYLNTLFSQKDCLQTTEGYNYIALEDDVWVYTGVTSVGGDESLVGFVLMNQRTSETKYYAISGAKEYSAMGSAEGKVQHLGYNATFPLLLNIANEPTYVLTLKDSAGLVKSYAMVNIEQYTIVAIGDTITSCEKNYVSQLKDKNITSVDASSFLQAYGTIEKIAQGVVDGNSHYYIMLTGNNAIFDVTVAEQLSIIRYNVGDTIKLSYQAGSDINIVEEIIE